MLELTNFQHTNQDFMKSIALKKPHKHYLGFIAIVLFVVATEFWITTTSHFYESTLLPLAVSIDLVVILPILYFLVVVKPLKVNIISLCGVVVACIGLGYWIIPKSHQIYLHYAEYALIALEVGVLGWGLVKIRKIIKDYKALSAIQTDFIRNIHQAFEKHLGNSFFVRFFVSELVMLRYGLFFWLSKKNKIQENEFTLHKESVFVPTFSVFLFMSVLELVVVHLLLMNSTPMLSWILTGLSVYSFVFLVAYMVSIVRRKITIEQDKIIIRVGKIWNFEIEKSNILEIISIKDADNKDRNILNVGSLLMTQPNVLIKLQNKIVAKGIYGIKKEISQVALVLDKPEEFIKQLS